MTLTVISALGALVFLSQGLLVLLMPDRMVAIQRRVAAAIGLRHPVIIDQRRPAERAMAAFSLVVGLLYLIQLVSE